jgi:hypothetical protein
MERNVTVSLSATIATKYKIMAAWSADDLKAV